MTNSNGNGKADRGPPDGLTPWHGIVHPKKLGFLRAYPILGTISSAARAVKIERGTHYDWVKNDPVYAEAFKDVRADFVDQLEEEAFRRAVTGIEEPATVAGQRELIRRYDTTLLIFLLKGAAPEKYRDRLGVVNENAADLYNEPLADRISPKMPTPGGNGNGDGV